MNGRLRPRFMVRDRSVLTGFTQRTPQRFGVTVADPVTDEPFELTVFRYPGPANAPQLLAVHGFRGDHHGLELVIDGLADFDVWVPDLPGFGASPAMPAAHHDVEHYAAVITQLRQQLDSPILLGHSFGSVIAACAAAAHPTYWKHLVLLNPITKPALTGHSWINRTATAITDGFYRLCANVPRDMGRWLLSHPMIVWATGAFMTKTDDPRIAAYTHDQHQAYFSGFSSPDVLLQAYRSSIRHTVADFATGLQMPITLIAGAQDELSTPDDSRALADALQEHSTDVEFYILPNTGHLLHYERAVTTAALLHLRWQS